MRERQEATNRTSVALQSLDVLGHLEYELQAGKRGVGDVCLASFCTFFLEVYAPERPPCTSFLLHRWVQALMPRARPGHF